MKSGCGKCPAVISGLFEAEDRDTFLSRMGAVSEPPLALHDLHVQLREARSSIKAKRWKKARRNLQQIMQAGEDLLSSGQHRLGKQSKASKTDCRDAKTASEVCCARLLLECGRLWNSLLCMERAIACFRLAETLSSSPCWGCCSRAIPRLAHSGVGKANILNALIEKVCCRGQSGRPHREVLLDVVQARMQTYLYLFQSSKANELFESFFGHSKEPTTSCRLHGHSKAKSGAFAPPSFTPDARSQLVAKGLVLDVAQGLVNEAKPADAVKRLTSPSCVNWAARRVTGDFADRCLEAEHYSLLAYTRYLSPAPADHDASSTRSSGEIFSDVYRLWQKLQWPLDYAESIVNMLSHYAIERIENGHYGAENPIVNTLLNLNTKLWTYCGDVSFSIGRNMYDVSQAAEKIEKHQKAAQYGERTVAVFRACPEYLPERTMFIGAAMYLVGLNYFKENRLDLAVEHIEQCIPLLEQSAPMENSSHYLFAMKTLAQAYGDLAHALKIQCGAVEQSLLFSEKALRHRQFLTHSAIKTAQAIRADSLHCKGALIEHGGNLEEAEHIYREANKMFIETVMDCTNSFEFVAYGYFLYRRNDFVEAARMLQKGYEFASTGFPSLMFTHDEWHTLTEELKFEVQNSAKKSFDAPNRVVALYFHIMVLIRTGGESGERYGFCQGARRTGRDLRLHIMWQ